MDLTPCRICGGASREHFTATILGRYDVPFQYCEACDHIFAADPYWLEEAYSDAVVATDTDIAVRNIVTALKLASLYRVALNERGQGRYADVAGGYGLLVRLLRDLGFDCFWSDRYAQNLFARGFEYDSALGPCVAISAMEAVEHAVNPREFIAAGLQDCGADTIVFSTGIFADGQPPLAKQWDYYALDHGQHIAFFSHRGLARLAKRLGLHYHALGRLHLMTRRKIAPWRLKLASNPLLAVAVALQTMAALGSRRNQDQSQLLKALRRSRT